MCVSLWGGVLPQSMYAVDASWHVFPVVDICGLRVEDLKGSHGSGWLQGEGREGFQTCPRMHHRSRFVWQHEGLHNKETLSPGIVIQRLKEA